MQCRKYLLQLQPKFKRDIVLKNLNINKIILNGILSNANLNMSRISTREIILDGFYNQSKLVLRHISPKKEAVLRIKNSDLGATYLNDIDFSQFYSSIIFNSTLKDVNYSNVIWPDEFFISEDRKQNKTSKDHEKLHNTYRQLKQAARNNQNKIDELLFRGKEWSNIRKAGVNKNEAWYWQLNDWFILATNRSNDFGTNWIRPILLLLASNLFFFVLILIAISEDVSIFEFDRPMAIGELYQICKENFWLYLHFLNPTHNLKHFETFLTPPHFTGFINNGWAMSLNVLMRITTGYFIYQTISAFRKFSKK